VKSLKIRIRPDHYQKICLETLANEHRLLYNHLLKGAKEGLGFKEINERYKSYREAQSLTIQSKVAQNTSRMLINSIKSFYSLKKKDKSAKFPFRFKSWKQFQTINYDWNSGNGGFKFDEDGSVSMTLDRKSRVAFKMPNIVSKKGVNALTVKTLSIKRDDRFDEPRYFFQFTYSEKPSNNNLNKENFISIDLGVSQIATAFSNTVKNFSIQTNRFRNIERQKEHVQSLRDRCKKGSRRHKKLTRAFRKLCRTQSNKNIDFQHKVSRKIVDHCVANDVGTIIVGDIKTKKLPKSKKSSRGLNKATQNQGTLSRFKTFLAYKSKSAGIDFHLVNEAYTSQLNCLTGKRDFSSDLSIREVEIQEGVKIDRDLNAATNIAARIMGEWFIHTQNLIDYLSGFDKMFVDHSSQMRMITNEN
jgi:putative transposase